MQCQLGAAASGRASNVGLYGSTGMQRGLSSGAQLRARARIKTIARVDTNTGGGSGGRGRGGTFIPVQVAAQVPRATIWLGSPHSHTVPLARAHATTVQLTTATAPNRLRFEMQPEPSVLSSSSSSPPLPLLLSQHIVQLLSPCKVCNLHSRPSRSARRQAPRMHSMNQVADGAFYSLTARRDGGSHCGCSKRNGIHRGRGLLVMRHDFTGLDVEIF